MSVIGVVDVQTTAMWPQGDERDPLGVWGFRKGLTGDATAGVVQVTAQAPAGLRAAYIYTCYSLNLVQLTGAVTTTLAKSRLLTNWPNVDPIAGVQAYNTTNIVTFSGTAIFDGARAGFREQMVYSQDRFILLFDPRSSGDTLDIIELQLGLNTDLATYSFEGYGYYWDRSVFQAPGGPRHPGAS